MIDDGATLYDQAFQYLALASVDASGLPSDRLERATALRDLILVENRGDGPFVETGKQPYQSNANMHFLEVRLAMEERTPDDHVWRVVSDRIIKAAVDSFITPSTGALHEFFTETWDRTAGFDGRLVEPGHPFEWSWLFVRHGMARGAPTSFRRPSQALRGRNGRSRRAATGRA